MTGFGEPTHPMCECGVLAATMLRFKSTREEAPWPKPLHLFTRTLPESSRRFRMRVSKRPNFEA